MRWLALEMPSFFSLFTRGKRKQACMVRRTHVFHALQKRPRESLEEKEMEKRSSRYVRCTQVATNIHIMLSTLIHPSILLSPPSRTHIILYAQKAEQNSDKARA